MCATIPRGLDHLDDGGSHVADGKIFPFLKTFQPFSRETIGSRILLAPNRLVVCGE